MENNKMGRFRSGFGGHENRNSMVFVSSQRRMSSAEELALVGKGTESRTRALSRCFDSVLSG